jgi:phage tail-like protein
MMPRDTPYGAFNFLVDLGGGVAAGFSDVSGLTTEMTVAEYRNGNEAENHVRKIPGVHKTSDVTCKRGLIGSSDLFDWIKQTRTDGYKAKRTVVITLLDESRNPVQKWTLSGAMPLKLTGPTLAAKGGGDVAMEELVLSVEGLETE